MRTQRSSNDGSQITQTLDQFEPGTVVNEAQEFQEAENEHGEAEIATQEESNAYMEDIATWPIQHVESGEFKEKNPPTIHKQ